MYANAAYPHVTMISLEPEEEILVTAKKHWITYVGVLLAHGFLFCVVLTVLFFLYSSLAQEVVVSLIWLIASSCVWLFITQYLDTWYVTNKRIVAIDQIELFDRSESNVLMSRVQDVQFKKSGILQEFLGYGTLTVQSAGEEREFIIHDVANVEEIAGSIIDQKMRVVPPSVENPI